MFSIWFVDGHIAPVMDIRIPYVPVMSLGSEKKKKRGGTGPQEKAQSVTAIVFNNDHTVISGGNNDRYWFPPPPDTYMIYGDLLNVDNMVSLNLLNR